MLPRLPLVLAATVAVAPLAAAQDLAARVRDANNHLLNMGHVTMATDFFAPVVVIHVAGQDMRGGPELIRDYVTQLRTAFPDLRVEVEVLAVQGDRVAWLRTCRGTHRGDYMGTAPTNRMLVWRDMVVTRFEDDRVVEEWAVSDMGDALRAAAGGSGR